MPFGIEIFRYAQRAGQEVIVGLSWDILLVFAFIGTLTFLDATVQSGRFVDSSVLAHCDSVSSDESYICLPPNREGRRDAVRSDAGDAVRSDAGDAVRSDADDEEAEAEEDGRNAPRRWDRPSATSVLDDGEVRRRQGSGGGSPRSETVCYSKHSKQ